MPARGKFIVFEGIDGSGKRTQMEMLARALGSQGIELVQMSFPRYDGFFGKMVGQFLNGDFGPLEAVDPHFSALLYAGDRLESKPEIEAALAARKIVLTDRYVGSNLAHQGARVREKKRREFLKWLKQLEYEVYRLPREDLVIYLRVPAAEARRLVGQKAAREYTKRRRDLQETSLAHLRTASNVYDDLARQPNWIRIDCAETTRERRIKIPIIHAAALRESCSPSAQRRADFGVLRTPETIHKEILDAVDASVLARAASRG
jgi:dTMP kinase